MPVIPGNAVPEVQLNAAPAISEVGLKLAVSPEQIVIVIGELVIDGAGFTVIKKVCGEPLQPFAEGVTTIADVIAAVPVFVAIKEAMSPVPLAAIPVAVLLFVHANVVPDTAPVKVIAVVLAPLHRVWLVGTVTVGVGLTVIV
jgi:hypothetical protein